jgi:hypothetical protein
MQLDFLSVALYRIGIVDTQTTSVPVSLAPGMSSETCFGSDLAMHILKFAISLNQKISVK